MKKARILFWNAIIWTLENLAGRINTDIQIGNYLDFEERISLERLRILLDTAIHAAHVTEHELHDPARANNEAAQ